MDNWVIDALESGKTFGISLMCMSISRVNCFRLVPSTGRPVDDSIFIQDKLYQVQEGYEIYFMSALKMKIFEPPLFVLLVNICIWY